MDRRQFVAGASVGVPAVASTFPKPAIAQGVRELKMVTIWPKTLPGLQSAADRVAQSITALSGGRLQVKVFAAGQMVGAFESFEAVSSGLADMYHASEITWAGRSAAFSYFCNVPFGFTPNEINAWIYHGGGQALWDELSAGFGLKPFMCGNTGPQMGGWFTKELTSVDSYKGLRYRMPGIGGEVLRRLGAVVVNVPPGEIIASLKSGAIDASEFAGPWVDMSVGLHKAVLLLSGVPRAGGGDVPRRQQEIVGRLRQCGARHHRDGRRGPERIFIRGIHRQRRHRAPAACR